MAHDAHGAHGGTNQDCSFRQRDSRLDEAQRLEETAQDSSAARSPAANFISPLTQQHLAHKLSYYSFTPKEWKEKERR
jgi:hypothetical protein